ncbi:MAG TPA: carboxypeptidase-like regulatory domain-containing protein [Terriglobales bacterium]
MGSFRSRWLLALALQCLRAATMAQEMPSVSTASDARFSLSGTVINAATSEPVRRAMVQLMNVSIDSGHTTMTDSEGRFEFNDLPAGQGLLQVRKPGFFSPEELNESPGQALNQMMTSSVTIGADAPSVVLELIPEGLIHGRIETREGEPVEGLPIRAMFVHIANGRRQSDQIGAVVTDEDGAYRIANLKPGAYYIVAGPGDRATWMEGSDGRAHPAGYPLEFYPGVTDVAAAAPIEVAPGQQVQTDMALQPQPLFKISGSVTGLQKGQGISLFLTGDTGSLAASPVSYNNGEFHASVPAGSYVLRATVQNDGSFPGAAMPLLVKSDVAGIRLVIGPQSAIPVHLKLENVRPPSPDDDNRPKLDPPGVALHLVRDGLVPEAYDFFSNQDTRNADNAIRNLSSGRYSVELRVSNQEWYVQSAQCGDANLLRDQLNVSSEGQMPPLEIVLRNDGGTLSGTLTADGQPASGMILLIRDRAPRQPTQLWASTDGQFSAPNLAPGDYTVVAFSHTEGLEYSNPDVLAPYLSHASHVTLPPNGESKVSVAVTQGEK